MKKHSTHKTRTATSKQTVGATSRTLDGMACSTRPSRRHDGDRDGVPLRHQDGQGLFGEGARVQAHGSLQADIHSLKTYIDRMHAAYESEGGVAAAVAEDVD